jgi:acyl-coenzyme A synthetase/AMP-(fatty) acid ligase/acyl carrier protein
LSGREVDLVPALLGVLASGAAFSVVDADAPAGWSAERIGSLSAKAGLVVSGRAQPDVCPQWIGMADVVKTGPNRIGAVDGAGYAAFTSGTTGRPRGVRGGIAPIAHFVDWYADAFGIGHADRFALLSTPGHDPLLRDVFTPLWVGATLCVPGAGLIRTPVALLEWLRRERITVLHLTPALGRLLNLAADGVRTEVRLVCLGGDVLHAEDVAGIARWAPDAVVVNGYGATETPQLASCAVCTGTGEPTIGRAAPGAQLLVTNADGGLAGIGELGRIVVRGPYLAEGYLDGTTGGFAEDLVAGHRRFDTGDLGRYRPDGAIELLGRLDDQVQIRGFRVEPAELDRRLRTLPTVRDSASVALRGPDGENRLVSYLVADQPAPDVATVRAHLRDLLPAALLPAEVYLVEEIRLTRNGKPDRAALAGMAAAAPPRRPPAGGVNRLEERIIEVWREVLDVGAIDPDRNFFDLGASSVLMIRAQLALQQRLGRELPITALFEHASVRALAAHLADADRAAGPAARPAPGRQRSSMRARRLAARAGVPTQPAHNDAEGQP